MSLRLGRVVVNEPTSWQDRDGAITIVGSYKASSLTDGLVKRDQILGLADNWDEPIIPVIMDGEPRVTGYYRVIGSSFTTDNFTRLQGNLYDYQVDLQRITGFAQPIFESILSGALLSNAVGGVAADLQTIHGVPGQAVSVSGVNSLLATEYWKTTGVTLVNRSNNDVGGLVGTGYSGISLYVGVNADIALPAKWYVAPADYYTCSARIEQGSPLQPVVGRLLVQSDVTNWRISNGLVSVAGNAANPGQFDVSVVKAVSSNLVNYGSAKRYQITTGAAYTGALTRFTSFTVLRNAPEECIIRLGGSPTGILYSSVFLDISIRRGDMIARCYLSSPTTQTFGVARSSTAEAGTAITFGAVTLGGIRATAADADTNYYVLLSYQAATTSTTTSPSLILNAAATAMDFAVGGGTSPGGTFNAYTDLAKQYLAAQSESQRIVAR